jgi:hypothetical protein
VNGCQQLQRQISIEGGIEFPGGIYNRLDDFFKLVIVGQAEQGDERGRRQFPDFATILNIQKDQEFMQNAFLDINAYPEMDGDKAQHRLVHLQLVRISTSWPSGDNDGALRGWVNQGRQNGMTANRNGLKRMLDLTELRRRITSMTVLHHLNSV